MDNLYNTLDAQSYSGDLGQLIYVSRLLGGRSDLVLFGGGNTSVKVVEPDMFGELEERLYVKGSGHDLATIGESGFTPLRLTPTRRLGDLKMLSDPDMVNALASYKVRADAPAPSVEAILHAFLPHKFVVHTHADAVVTITNTPHGADFMREIYGDRVLIIPYIMPGFRLARGIIDLWRTHATDRTEVMILLNHGIFTWGETAKQAYDSMIAAVTQAEDFLKSRSAWKVSTRDITEQPPEFHIRLATLRHAVSVAAGAPMLVSQLNEIGSVQLIHNPHLMDAATRGLLTPDHVIRTKRIPLVGRDVNAYVEQYRAYFNEYAPRTSQPLQMVDPAPRVVYDPELGMVAFGRTKREASLAHRIAWQTAEAILRAEALDRWLPLGAWETFEVEYWDLEQAKLKRQPPYKPFAGEIALVTGAASGIGKAIAQLLLDLGAVVAGLDIDQAINKVQREDFAGIQCDITSDVYVHRAIGKCVRQFGGLDMLVLNAGIFPASAQLKDLDGETWRKTMAVNLDANLTLLREAYPYLKLAPNGGRVVVVGSKNVPAPGPGAAAYSTSKAALNQLARVAALEWGGDGIRVNTVHPNQVFDTALWTLEILEARAKHYGLTADEYKRNNVLRTEVTSHDVAAVVCELLGPRFSKTTGAQIPVDGGNDRVI